MKIIRGMERNYEGKRIRLYEVKYISKIEKLYKSCFNYDVVTIYMHILEKIGGTIKNG